MMRFLSLDDVKRPLSHPVLVPGIVPDVFSPQFWVISSCACTDNFSAEILRGSSTDVQGSDSVKFSPL